MLNPLRLDVNYRDWWQHYTSFAAAQVDDILNSGCYAPRYYHAPRNPDELITGPNGYLKYSLVITPGSWIVGYWHRGTTAANAVPSFLVMITDLALNHRWFTTPISEEFFDQAAPLLANLNNHQPAGPSMLCAPYPVVDPGSFLVEFWQPNNATNRCQLTFAVAEPIPSEVGDPMGTLVGVNG